MGEHDRRTRNTSGGAAAHRGITYQDRVAAWMAVYILAEELGSPPWGLEPHTTLDYLRCETEQPVGDLLVGTSQHGHSFIEVKTSINASKKIDSALASVIDQMVRQLLSYRGHKANGRPWERPLELERDRLVLVTSSDAPTSVIAPLSKLLSRLHDLSSAEQLNEALATADERRIFDIIHDHLKRSWREYTGTEITNNETFELLKFAWIQVLDVNDSGRDEREAKNLLRLSILHDPSDADSAWNALLKACSHFAASRSGSDRVGLQRVLAEAGVRIKAPPSYRSDIDKLKQYSVSTLESLTLKRVSTIPMGDTSIKVRRPSSVALREATEGHSLVLVGEPGAGKSGALYDLVLQLLEEARDVVFLTLDRIEASSLGALRQELGLEHEIVDCFRNWPADKRPILILDALDAARSETAAKTFYELISHAGTDFVQWRVITSIRKFDLRHNASLQQLFAGRPPTAFQLPEFSNVCHLNVPVLDVDEWVQIATQAPELAELYTKAGSSLRELLLVPFNVRLAAELIGTGVEIEQLTSVETQIGLLGLYWRERVGTDQQGTARELLLQRVVDRMVEARSLRANRRDVIDDAALVQPLRDVLSSGVLSEWQPQRTVTADSSILTFSHHVLFDYAVARLLLRGTAESLVESLAKEPDVVMAIRPSLVMHFQYEWQRDRVGFWHVVFRVISSNDIPEVAKLIGPMVAVESAKSIDDFSDFFSSLSSNVLETRETAEKCLRHMTGALLVSATRSAGPDEDLSIWLKLLEGCTRDMRVGVAYSIRPLLLTFCSNPDFLSAEQLSNAGIIARRLFNFAFGVETYDPMLVGSGIEAVCHTFESDPEASATCLRKCLESEHVNSYGYEELFRLGHELDRLIELDPQLVEDIYAVTFTHHDPREHATPLLASRILPLTTTPRQEFDMARWVLATKYELFLQKAPLHAFRSLLVALSTYVTDYYYSRLGDRPEQQFDFNRREAVITSDFSQLWDEGSTHADDQPVRMLNTFQRFIEATWQDSSREEERQRILDIVISENRTAVIWSRLLMSAGTLPLLARELLPLAWALPILTNDDTSYAVGEYLTRSFSTFSEEERKKVETAVLSISTESHFDHETLNKRDSIRNRLLGCLDINLLITNEAKMIRETQNIPTNKPLFTTSIVSGVYTDEDYLRDRGVSVNEEQNRAFLRVMEPVKEFGGKYRNEAPTLESAESVLPDLYKLQEALSAAKRRDVPESERNLAWGYMAEAARALAEVSELSEDSNVGRVAKTILLDAAKCPDPAPHPEIDAQFDRHPSWGSPAPRLDAAHGLIRISRHKTQADNLVFEAIENLLKDPVPAVRYQVAINLAALYETNNDLMRRLLEERSAEDESRGVLQGMLVGALRRLAPYNPDQVTKCVVAIFNRVRDGDGATEVRRRSGSIFAGLYLWQRQPECGEIVGRIVADPIHYSSECGQIVFDVRNWLNLGPVDPSNSEKDAIRIGSFSLLERMLRSILEQWKALDGKYAADRSKTWSAEDQEAGRTLARLAEAVCQHLYFMSGAYKDLPSDQAEGIALAPAERSRYLHESRAILELLSEFPFPSLTHYLLQMLEFFIPYDPAEVFLLVGRVVRSGKAGGYQYESMAVDLIVRMVERFIAEFRHILRDNEECRRTLIEILDTFVDAGWASARQLTYRMEDIFR